MFSECVDEVEDDVAITTFSFSAGGMPMNLPGQLVADDLGVDWLALCGGQLARRLRQSGGVGCLAIGGTLGSRDMSSWVSPEIVEASFKLRAAGWLRGPRRGGNDAGTPQV